MGFFDRGGGALSSMAQDAAKFGELVRNRRMRTEWLRLDVDQARLAQRDVTGGATVHHAEFGNPDLLNAVRGTAG